MLLERNQALEKKSQVLEQDLGRAQLESCTEKDSWQVMYGGVQYQLALAEEAMEAWKLQCTFLEQQNWQIQTVMATLANEQNNDADAAGWRTDLDSEILFRLGVLEQRLDKSVGATDKLKQSLGQA
eukprot:2021775-Karenia_brevis.AAC.1